MTKQTTAPVCQIDFYADSANADPAKTYGEMLKHGPVTWLEKHGLHAICGHKELTESLRNHQVFQSGKGVSINEDVNAMLIGSTLNSDPPQHDVTRAITFSPLTPKALKDVRERIETEADKLAQTIADQGTFDAASELAPHLPLTIVRDLVGLGDDGKDNMLDWGAATFELMGDSKERRPSAINRLKQLRDFLEDDKTLDNLSPMVGQSAPLVWASKGACLPPAPSN